MNIFKRARVIYILHRHKIKHELWESVSNKITLIQGMTAVEKAHLHKLSTLFLYEKNIYGVQDFQITDAMRVMIATQACLPILGLGIELFNGWSDVIIYPAAFQVSRDQQDKFGIVHHEQQILSGESWSRGPVILSWHDIQMDSQSQSGHNVIVHEIAHKLDMLNGNTNGMPPLHFSMQTTEWTAACKQAYEILNQRIEHQHPVCINPYAASSPAEFFAVCSEYFFSAPEILHTHFSDVYQQFRLYYRQDPLSRISQENNMP